MKKLFLGLILLAAVLLSSCANEKKIDNVIYEPYGLVNEDTHKNDSIQYEVSFGSVAFAIIFSETIIAPVYVVGWDLYQPVSKIGTKDKGVRK
jgi:hypothetical protein